MGFHANQIAITLELVKSVHRVDLITMIFTELDTPDIEAV